MKVKISILMMLAALVCSLFLFPASPVAATEEQPPTLDTLSADQVAKSFDHASVLATFESGSVARLILKLSVPDFTGTAGLEGTAEADEMAKIDSAQAQFADTFGPDLTEGMVSFDYIPYVSVWVETVDEYAALLASPMVLTAQQDIPVPADELNLGEDPAPAAMAQAVPWIDADNAHTLGYDGDGWAVAILDTGVDKDHYYLDSGKVVSEACYSTTNSGEGSNSLCPSGAASSTANNSAQPYNTGVCDDYDCDHGTHVAGIAAGTHTGFTGIAPHADLIAVQVFSAFNNYTYCGGDGTCALSWTTDQIGGLERVYALRSTYDIASVNMSLGGGKYTSACNSDARAAIIGNLKTAGIAVAIATGNSYYKDGVGAPSCISDAIAVGATGDVNDLVTDFSNAAAGMVDVWAPGKDITSSVPTEMYGAGSPTAEWDGTSMATPIVAGAWAALKEAYPSYGVDEIYNLIDTYGVSVTDQRPSGVAEAPRIDFTNIFDPLTVTDLDKTILRSPGVDAIVYGGRPTLKWYPVDGATTYDIELYDQAFLLIGSWTKGTGACATYCEYRISFDLESDFGEYEWRVRARNTVTSATGDWSDTRLFIYTQLDRTSIISPADGYVSDTASPTLQWSDITGATMYLVNFRLPDDTFVGNILVSDATFCDGSTCTWDLTPGLSDGDYIWHVRAKNGRNFGRWTAYRAITIAAGGGGDDTITFDFNGSAPGWIDPDNKWDIQNSATYTGTYGACTYNCATTIYNTSYADAIFETRIRSTGTNGDDGYTIYFRTDYDSSGNFTNGLEIDFYQDGSDIGADLYAVENGSWYYLGTWLLTGKDISLYHTLKVETSGTNAYFYIDGSQFGSLTGIPSATHSAGKFSVDVISSTASSHLVDMDWATITNNDSSAAAQGNIVNALVYGEFISVDTQEKIR